MLSKFLTCDMESKWHELVDDARNIILVGHAGPDGDAMGSTLAMFHYLKSLGKNPTVVMPNAYPGFLEWLPGCSTVVIAKEDASSVKSLLEKAELLIFMDFSSEGRTEELEDLILSCGVPHIIIDHHLNPSLHADLLISNPQSSSTCELLFCLLAQLGAYSSMSKECAECIYCGMMTDTGGFTYNSNRAEIFYIISQLLTKGVDKDAIYKKVYHNYSEERIRLLGYILNEKMVYLPEFHASYFALTREEMERYNFKKGDAEGIVNIPLEIKGTKLSISLREDAEKSLVRVSLRSVGDFPSNQMAGEFFNGGGHLNASGGSVEGTIEEAVEITKKAIDAYKSLLKNNKS